MTKLKIKVTKEILKKSMYCGTKSESTELIVKNCAVALAVRDIFPEACVASRYICPFGSRSNPMGPEYDIELPQEASSFISRFDGYMAIPEMRLKMEEFEFEVEIPDIVIEQINIDEIKPLLENHPTLKLV
jgi:hypothetical protein